jgi:DNA polymerase (family 10)
MTIHNAEIADALFRLAELLEIEGANPFRVRAYRNAARTVGDLPESVAALLAEGRDLAELPGIGKDLAGKIKEIVDTGHLRTLEEVERHLPASLVEMASVPGLGPKRIKLLHDELKIDNLDKLAKAAAAGRLAALPGFGAKLEAKIREALAHRTAGPKRTRLAVAEEVARDLLDYLEASKGVGQAVIAGSYRRRRETVGDLDILVTVGKGSDVMARFVAYPEVRDVLGQGPTRATVLLRSGLQVDLRAVPPESYGAALHYFTGSKDHNIAVRRMGVAKGLKINEYGVFKGTKRIAGRTEEEIYKTVRLPYIEPELREGRGEIEAAQAGRLPRLVTLADIRGDLHAHTKASDGHASIVEMAEAAKARGYAYLAISDHSRRVTVAHGLDARRLGRQIDEIERVAAKLKGIRILKAVEVDILEDGGLDLPDSILEKLDFTVAAIHSKFELSQAKQTDRIIRAMDNPNFTILAHPTGRLIGEREPYVIDMERVMAAAKERGCFLEINAQPERLDLNDVHARLAKEMGVKVAISTDAHSTANLDFMRFGVDQARRGWLEPADVLNTRGWDELRRLFKRR